MEVDHGWLNLAEVSEGWWITPDVGGVRGWRHIVSHGELVEEVLLGAGWFIASPTFHEPWYQENGADIEAWTVPVGAKAAPRSDPWWRCGCRAEFKRHLVLAASAVDRFVCRLADVDNSRAIWLEDLKSLVCHC